METTQSLLVDYPGIVQSGAAKSLLDSFLSFPESQQISVLARLSELLLISSPRHVLVAEIDHANSENFDLFGKLMEIFLSLPSAAPRMKLYQLISALLQEYYPITRIHYQNVYAALGGLLGPLESVERVQENYDTLMLTLKLLKTMQISQKSIEKKVPCFYFCPPEACFEAAELGTQIVPFQEGFTMVTWFDPGHFAGQAKGLERPVLFRLQNEKMSFECEWTGDGVIYRINSIDTESPGNFALPYSPCSLLVCQRKNSRESGQWDVELR